MEIYGNIWKYMENMEKYGKKYGKYLKNMDFFSCPPIVRRPENVTKKMQEQKTAFVLQTPHTTQHLCGTITTFR